ncbi:MAG: SIMPL domain-containing protein, partial [Candidatus Staskawiczbacteria bacterium]
MDEQTIKFFNRAFMLAQILIVGVLVFFVGQILLQNKSIDQQNANQITVSGEGKVYAKPDVALVSLGVTTTATTVADVTKSNTNKMNTIIAAVKKLGVADKDIETTNYNLTPVYNNNVILPTPVSAPGVYSMPYIPVTTGTTLKGYSLEQDVQVKIRDFTKVGDILS